MSGDPTEESLYVWQVFDADERWGTIAAATDLSVAPIPLCFRDRAVAEHARPYALHHGRGANRPVRLARYVHHENLEEQTAV
jgi:hypothetical protein